MAKVKNAGSNRLRNDRCAYLSPLYNDNKPVTCRYVKTSDGTVREFQPGEVMFQDNSKDNPGAKVKSPEHESGTVPDAMP